MRIAFFASAFHPHIGGVEEVVRQLAQQERLGRREPLVVTNRYPKDLPESETFEELPVRRYVFRVPERTMKQIGGTLLFAPGTLRTLCADLRQHRTEVIHAHCVSSNVWYALLASKRLRLPLVVTLHSELTMDANRLFERSEFARSLMRRALTESDAVTAVSRKTLADAEAFYGKPLPRPARVIYNGLDLDEFTGGETHRNERPYLLGIGRLVPQKGFDVLIRAFAAAGLAEHELLIAGDGVERPALEALSSELGVSGHVRFLGRVNRARTIALFNGCEFLALPSRADEGLPMVTMEALAAGRPIVASRVGGVPESVIDGETGLLVPKDDVAALTAAVRRLAGDAELRARLRAGAKTRAEQFRWTSISAQYAELYGSLPTRSRVG